MDPGDYRTNVLSVNNLSSIKYEYFETRSPALGSSRKLLQRLEASWRQEARLVHCDTYRDGIWVFQNAIDSSSPTNLPNKEKGPIVENGSWEAHGIQIALKEQGTFESQSLARSRQAASSALNSASSNSSPSSSLENASRNALALNARSVQANALYSLSQEISLSSPGQRSLNRSYDVWPSMIDVHESFISAVLGSLVHVLCRDEGYIPLSPRVLVSTQKDSTSPSRAVNSQSCSTGAVTLANLDISLTSMGTLVIKSYSDTSSGLQTLGCNGPLGAGSNLTPGVALSLAPLGNTAKFYAFEDNRGLPAVQSVTQPGESAPEPKPNNLNEAAVKAWQSKCIEWLSSKGIDQALIESGGWIFVQLTSGHGSYLDVDDPDISIFEGRTVVPWPTRLCFQASNNGHRSLSGSEPKFPGNRDPLAFAEEWFTGRDERTNISLKRQKERQVAEALSKEQADVEARALQSATTHSPAVLRRGSNAGAMYPTPPDAIHNPVGVTPIFDGAGSPPVNIIPFAAQDGPISAAPSAVAGNAVDMWGATDKADRNTSNTTFNDNNNDADLFGDLGGDMFGNDITDADFNFFDAPDNLQPDLKAESPKKPNLLETLAVKEPVAKEAVKQEGMHPPAKSMARSKNVNAQKQTVGNVNSSQVDAKKSEFNANALVTIKTKPVAKQEIPFSKESIYQQLVNESGVQKSKIQSRRASLFSKIEFKNSLSSVDAKYGDHGQFKISDRNVRPQTLEFQGLPQTNYLSTRRKSTDLPEANRLGRILLVEHKANEQLELDDAMDFLLDSDGLSQISEQDDISPITDQIPLISKIGIEQKLLDNGQGNALINFDPMAIDFEQSASTPHSAVATQFPLLEADPTDWSLTSYFTSPEPEAPSNTLTDLECIATAQILVDQAVSGTIQLSCIGDNGVSHNKSNTKGGLVRSVAKATKVFFKDLSSCTLRSFSEIQGIPVMNLGGRLPPRPVNPRVGTASEPGRLRNPFPIQPPQLELRRSDSQLSVLPSAVNFWENLGLAPSSGGKDVSAVCVYPNIDGIAANASIFLEQMRSTYESYRLGSHERLSSDELVDGVLSFPLDLGQQHTSRNLSTLRETAARLSNALAAAIIEEKNIVVYFVYPADNPTLLVHICSAFQHLFLLYRKALYDRKAKFSNELVLQLVPLEFVYSPITINVPPPAEYARLSMEVYDRCIDFESASRSPAIVLERPLPRSIDFKLNPNPSASVLQENTCLHIAYAQSTDDRWMTAVWTDNKGTQQMNASYCLGRKNEPISMPFAVVANEIWETTLDFISSKNIHWRIMIARIGVMELSEVDIWTELAARDSTAQINLTLLTVQTEPSLRLLSPPATLPTAREATQTTTPVSTPQGTSVLSPETSTTPNQNTAPGEASILDPDPSTRLLMLSDQTHGLLLSHRLSNSRTPLIPNPALISGYLVKHSTPTPILIEVNIVHNEVAGNPRTYYEGLLREVLGMYAGLGTLSRARGATSVGDARPWHIAAAERAVKVLHALM
ncbi:hypothetical protein HYALB_00007896 [Hymenoscyphus albidus]|uniref:Mediator of RNA polymerase II transcription subunit 13 n=1 Tax=Hymenoscyphus albidus TaxID=595503 RepID=A0A9N9Q5Q6_9HELO|nr:hypothetical protein HYALB_00007896 [Hymenoscyphus albidus]